MRPPVLQVGIILRKSLYWRRQLEEYVGAAFQTSARRQYISRRLGV